MNQILYTIENQEEKNRTKSIILFFAITIIIFGLLMISMGGYKMVLARAEKEKKIDANKVPYIELTSESNVAIINVQHVRQIKDIIYSWNEEDEEVLQENKTENIKETIPIPAGINTLNVRVIDIEGKTSQLSKEFAYEGTYMDLSIIDNESVKITVTDVDGLQSVTYKWNSEEEVVAYPEQLNQKVIEIVSSIPVGLNTIRVTAVNNKNQIEKKEVTLQGITKPTMKINYNDDKTLLVINLNDDQGIKSYSYTLSTAPISEIAVNGQIIPEFRDKLTVVTSQNKEGNGEKTITEEVTFQKGFNYLEVKITNIEGIEETFSGWCAK